MAVMARETWTDERLDHLSERMDERFDRVDGEMKLRFDLVDGRFKLVEKEMNAGFARVDERFSQVDERFKETHQRMDRADGEMKELRAALKDLHDDSKAMQRTITQAVISIAGIMIGGFAAIVAALNGAGAL
jgi:chromosome segregation ATPase